MKTAIRLMVIALVLMSYYFILGCSSEEKIYADGLVFEKEYPFYSQPNQIIPAKEIATKNYVRRYVADKEHESIMERLDETRIYVLDRDALDSWRVPVVDVVELILDHLNLEVEKVREHTKLKSTIDPATHTLNIVEN